eukprot:COSAG01_NODE_40965_length_457_cov_1.153631_1_plen_50_part_01
MTNWASSNNAPWAVDHGSLLQHKLCLLQFLLDFLKYVHTQLECIRDWKKY